MLSETLLDDFLAWASEYVTGYDKKLAAYWIEQPSENQQTIMLAQDLGGRAFSGDVQFPIVRLFLFGRANSGDAQKIYSDSIKLSNATMRLETLPCGATDVKIVSRPRSPGITATNRAWVQIDFQLIY